MSNSLPIIKMGHPNLRKSSNPISVEQITETKTQEFIDHLISTMREADGAGIAAPQVDILQRIFVVEIDENPRYPDKPSFPLLIAINPEIEPLGKEKIESWEGCLSIPNIRGKLMRWASIRLSAYDREGNFYQKELTGFPAVVAQHELDHLNGILFIDRMDDLTTLCFREEFQRYYQ